MNDQSDQADALAEARARLSDNAFAMGEKPAELIEADPYWGEERAAIALEPDERWQNSMVGTREDLVNEASRWEQSLLVPERISRMLGVSRSLFVHSYFVHEFAVVAVVWSLLAIEASLRLVLQLPQGDRTGFKKLIDKAQAQNFLTDEEAIQLNAGREFRNTLVHSDGQKTFTLGMTVPLLMVGHSLVARLFERSEMD